jgi:GntR family transcriptional repressor for pyruvate dehydrogenase complex
MTKDFPLKPLPMEISFDKIKRPSTLSQEIVESIERSILEKKLIPGQKLPTEQELCEMFSVSRTSVREALRMLSARGLVSIKKRSGIFVSEFSSSDALSSIGLYLELNFDRNYILHVFDIRRAIEPEVCQWAAIRREPTDLENLEANLARMELCDPEDRVKENLLDQEFHSLIALASRNPVVPLVLEPVFSLMPRIRAMVYANIPNCKSSALYHHRRIMGAIRQQDGATAFRAMAEHIGNAAEQANEVIDILNRATHQVGS